MCVCVWERERDAHRVTSPHISYLNCGLERDRVTSQRSVQRVRNILNHGLFANTYELHHCVCHETLFPFQAWTDAKTLLTVFTLVLKAEAHDYGKGSYISNVACGVRPITMLCVSWPIRADCACRKEGLCRKRSVWERRGLQGLEDLKYCTVFEK